MSYKNFSFPYKHDGHVIIEHVKKIYHTNDNGNFRRIPDSEYSETVSGEFYENFIKSIPFFNGFFNGTCKGEYSYTNVGYFPTKVITVNPSHDEKHIDTFTLCFNY